MYINMYMYIRIFLTSGLTHIIASNVVTYQVHAVKTMSRTHVVSVSPLLKEGVGGGGGGWRSAGGCSSHLETSL